MAEVGPEPRQAGSTRLITTLPSRGLMSSRAPSLGAAQAPQTSEAESGLQSPETPTTLGLPEPHEA